MKFFSKSNNSQKMFHDDVPRWSATVISCQSSDSILQLHSSAWVPPRYYPRAHREGRRDESAAAAAVKPIRACLIAGTRPKRSVPPEHIGKQGRVQRGRRSGARQDTGTSPPRSGESAEASVEKRRCCGRYCRTVACERLC